MSVEENGTTIEKWVNEANKHNFNVIDECFSDDFVAYHSTGMVFDRQQYKNAITNLRTNVFPDAFNTIQDVMVTEDRGALFLTWVGTQKGEWRGKPPTNKKIKVREIYFLRFEKGKISELRAYGDAYGMLYQLGIAPWWEEDVN